MYCERFVLNNEVVDGTCIIVRMLEIKISVLFESFVFLSEDLFRLQ